MASSFNCLIKQNQKLLISSIFVTKIYFIYEFITTELFIDKDVSKTMKPFMKNVFLNAENKMSGVSCWILFKSCDSTESENVNFIKISDEK